MNFWSGYRQEYILELEEAGAFPEFIKPHHIRNFLDGLFACRGSVGYPVPEPERLPSDGHLCSFSLKDTEQALALVLKDDLLCFRLFKSTKGVYKGNLSFDDRSI